MSDMVRARCLNCGHESKCTEFNGVLHDTDGACPQCDAKSSYETVDMEDELDPCPLCGGKAVMDSGNYDGTFCEESRAYCTSCCLLVMTGGDEWLVGAWNSLDGLLESISYDLYHQRYKNYPMLRHPNIWDLDYFTGDKSLLLDWYKNQLRQYPTAASQGDS